MQATKVQLSEIDLNTGQVPGLPRNPRIINDQKYRALLRSLKEDPEMIELRESIVYPYQGRLVAICGNQRVKGQREIGETETWVKILPVETSPEKLRAIAMKDNIAYGEFDMDEILLDWDTPELQSWGFDIKVDETEKPRTREIVPLKFTHILLSFPPDRIKEIQPHLDAITKHEWVEIEQGGN